MGPVAWQCQKIGFGGSSMSENWARGLVNVRRFDSRAWKCQKVGFGGLEISESAVRGIVNARNLRSKAWKC